jgi:hypothetical protein
MGEKPLTADEKHRIWLHQPKECLPEQRLCEENLLPLEEPTLPKEGVLGREPLLTRIGTPLSQDEYDMRKDADQKLLAQDPEKVLIETGGVLPRLTTADGQHALASMVPCQETKEGCKKGEGTDSADEESALTELAEALALAGAMATMQMNEDLHRPDGKRHGIIGGKDPNGINHPLMQAAVSVVMISAGVLSNPRAFAKSLRQAYKNRAVFVIKEVDEAGMKMGEKFAAKYPLFAADAMNKIGVIAPFKFMKLFTAKMGWRVQAHHILEVKWTGIFTLGDTELMPSVILTEAEHKEITTALRNAADERKPKTVAKLWDMYKEVYENHPAWLDAIKPYFGK